MKLSEKISARFADLEAQGKAVPGVARAGAGAIGLDGESVERWATSALHLVEIVFGAQSPHYKNLAGAYQRGLGWSQRALEQMRGVFGAAKSDYEGGYLFQVERTLSGELFGDFVVVADRALSEGFKDVAAVLACAALEDALKRYAIANGLDVDGKSMTEVVNALKAASLVSGPQKSLLDSMPRVRDAAMHADWTKITAQDVGSVIGYVKQFLISNFQ